LLLEEGKQGCDLGPSSRDRRAIIDSVASVIGCTGGEDGSVRFAVDLGDAGSILAPHRAHRDGGADGNAGRLIGQLDRQRCLFVENSAIGDSSW
ncbi:hypothetical protein, partial [Bradyrhizobium sp. NBAIM08]|uniref:hypothetical protein n=1 Tax=Bradyrhizobium sp. NBAIM08 TaxID=2793815 RepID=UPI001CD7A5D0